MKILKSIIIVATLLALSGCTEKSNNVCENIEYADYDGTGILLNGKTTDNGLTMSNLDGTLVRSWISIDNPNKVIIFLENGDYIEIIADGVHETRMYGGTYKINDSWTEVVVITYTNGEILQENHYTFVQGYDIDNQIEYLELVNDEGIVERFTGDPN